MNKPFISVIIPCYNEQEIIAETYHRVKQALMGDWNSESEILFINDGSSDVTFYILQQLAQEDNTVKVIHFSRNFGHQSAVTAGIAHCKGDLAFIIDADLQDPPELFAEMAALYDAKNCNVVNGVRTKREGEGWIKKTSAKLFYRLLNKLSDTPIMLDTGDFRLIDRKVINAFNTFPEKNKYIRGLISWMGFKQESFYYIRAPRTKGSTKYPMRKMLKLAFTAVFYFSKKPLKLATTLGFFSILIGIVLTIWVFFQELAGMRTVPGWASTVIIIIFFGGIQLLTMGVIGEYIGNVLDEVKNRPEYIVAEKINL